MASTSVQALLKDHEKERLRDRRSVQRKPFPRYVQIVSTRNRNDIRDAFSKDISHIGIGTIGQDEWLNQSTAELIFHLLDCKTVHINAMVRWTEPFGRGWYHTGWTFLE